MDEMQHSTEDGRVVKIDLDVLTTDKLVAERALIWQGIQEIEAQLADPLRAERLSPDTYTAWRSRAVWALSRRKMELQATNETIEERRRSERDAQERERRADKRRRHQANVSARKAKKILQERARADYEDAQAKRRALVATLADDGIENLLLRVWIAFHHIKGDIDFLAGDVTDDDRAALQDASKYLIERFGRGGLRHVINGRLAPGSAVAIEE